MAKLPHPLDPFSGKPQAGVIAHGMTQGFSDIIEGIRKTEMAITPSIPKALSEVQGFEVLKPGRSATLTSAFLTNLRSMGHQFRAELLDEASALRIHMLYGKEAKHVGAQFDVPIEKGGYITGMPGILREPGLQEYSKQVRRSEFATRGGLVLEGDQYRFQSWQERVYSSLSTMANVPVGSAQAMRELTRSMQKTISEQGYKSLVWSASRAGELMGEEGGFGERLMRGAYTRTGTPFDVFQMGVLGVYQGPGLESGKLINAYKSEFAFSFKEGEELWSPDRALSQIKEFHERIQKDLPFLKSTAIKPESALAGNMGIWELGHLTPFGGTSEALFNPEIGPKQYYGGADPTRQVYQRLAIARLRRSPARAVSPISTPVVEAMKELSYRQTGLSSRLATQAKIALVLDPRFEQAVAGSAGGAILTKGLADSLTADISGQANYESAKWANMIEKGEGRAYSKADIGANLITSFGSKHTIAGIQKMRGAQMAIGWSTFLKGKNPEALREAVLRDVLEQVGQWKHVPKGTSAFGRQMIQKKNDLIGDFYKDVVANVLGKDKSSFVPVTHAGGGEIVPQILVNPNARFDLDELSRLSEAINRHNTKIKALHEQGMFKNMRTIKEGFEVKDLRMAGDRFRSVMIHAAVMRRLESPEVVRKAVGAWTVPANELVGYSFALPDYSIGVGVYKNKAQEVRKVISETYNPYGTKMGLRDLTNLRMWHTKEADELAEVYKRTISRYQRGAKEEIAKTIQPFTGIDGFPAAFPKFRDAISANELANRFGKFGEAPYGAAGLTVEQLKGTIFAAGSPLRRKGVAIELNQAIRFGGLSKVPGEESFTKQIYLPALEAYRGIRQEMLGAGAPVGGADVFIDKLKRSHEQLYLSIATGEKDPRIIEAKYKEYQNLLMESFGGKSGMMSYFATARMAHSGYLGLVPGGTGALAKKLGTGLEGSSFAHISESTARQMGVFDLMKGGQSLYGRVTAYPGIAHTMETVLQFKMVKDSELGAKALRLSNMVALTMFRDFDMDKAAVTFMVGKQAQSAFKAFYEKSVQPLYGRYEEALNEVSKDDPELASLLAKDYGASREAGEAIKEAKVTGARVSARTMISLANEKSAAIRDRALGGLQEKFGTKVLTPAANWYLQSFRDLLESSEVVGALEARGIRTSRASLRAASSVIGLIEQQSAITKGKAIVESARGLLPLLHAKYDLASQTGREAYEGAVKQAGGLLAGMFEAGPEAGAKEIFAGSKGVGGWRYLKTQSMRESMARRIIGVGQLRRDILESTGGGMPKFSGWMAGTITRGQEGESAAGVAFRDLMQVHELEAAMANKPTAGMQIWNKKIQEIEQIIGWKKNIGAFGVGDDIAAFQERKDLIAKEGFGSGIQSAVNQLTKDAGGASGRTILDRAADWWTHTNTPAWQKAGVITGAALIMGAVAKNLFFSHYGSDAPVPLNQPLAFTPPPPIVPSTPIAAAGGPFQPSEQSYNLGKKPGGMWARVSNQLGFGPEAYDMEPREGMAPVKPAFGPRVSMPGVGLDVGPGIADSNSRPLIMAGPPVGGSPMPPSVAHMGPSESDIPYNVQQSEPVARVALPDYMRGGSSIRATAPERGDMTGSDLEGMARSTGSRAEIVTNRWDPREGIIDRNMATLDEESSSFS